MSEYHFGTGASVYITPEGSVTRIFTREVNAIPESTEEYRQRALDLGYTDTPDSPAELKMCQEHDLIHCFLAHALLETESHALWCAAYNQPASARTDEEEAMVLQYQKFLNTGEPPTIFLNKSKQIIRPNETN